MVDILSRSRVRPSPRGEQSMPRTDIPDSAINNPETPSVLIDEQPRSNWDRLWSLLKRGIARPSLLSSSSDTEATELDLLDSGASQATRNALRLLGGKSNGQRRPTAQRNGTRRGDSDVGGPLTPGDDLDEQDEEPVSVVVVCNELPDDDDALVGQASAGGTETLTRSEGGIANSPRSTSGGEAKRGMMMSKLRAAWIVIQYFFDQGFAECDKERSFIKERYYGQRQLSFSAGLYFLLMWLWYLALTPRPWSVYQKYAYIGIYGFFTIPVLPMISFNIPYRVPWFWQAWLGFATWALPLLGVIELNECNYFSETGTCSDDGDFVVFAGAVAQPTLAILALGQNRIVETVAFLTWFIVIAGFYWDDAENLAFYRDSMYYFAFHVFLLISNFITERNARQLFELREQLKLQYKATQRAQVMEKKASDLTKRFVSYIFHEVRVPLNTALLSVQNLEGEELFTGYSEDQKEMVDGLTGSLSMMEKVLNDVLSFNRMETGTFSLARVPFDLHKSIQLTALSHCSPAQMKGITLEIDLDPRIDKLECMFIGDEMRLRQITSNLVSNSIKFTREGSVKIVTRLLRPKVDNHEDRSTNGDVKDIEVEKGDAAIEEKRHGRRTAVVRIEVHDTGAGLRKRDLKDNRLFSPYVQTEMGRRQGGKGTGLGLALIRQIVQLSKGRLGVTSQFGKGSQFWFELPYPIYPRSRVPGEQSHSAGDSDATVVDPLDFKAFRTFSDGLIRRRSLRSEKEDDSAPLEGQMTAEQVLVTGPPERDSADQGSQDYFSRTNSSFNALRTYRQTSGTSIPPSKRSRSFKNDEDLSRASSKSKKEQAFTPRLVLSKDEPLSPRSMSPRPRSPVGTPALPQPQDTPASSQVPPSAAKDPDKPETQDLPTKGDFVTGSTGDIETSDQIQPHPSPGGPSPDDSTPVPPAPTASATADEDNGPLDVLIVDDDKLTRMMMGRMLKRLGHRVETAENGQVALEKITDAFRSVGGAVPVDVVFLDNQMPLMTGVEVASKVRQLGCPVYIVGCTGNALRQDQDEYIDAGADRILTKPIKQSSIEECIGEARVRARGESVPKGFEEVEGEGPITQPLKDELG